MQCAEERRHDSEVAAAVVARASPFFFLFCLVLGTRITTCYPDRAATCPFFVLFSYQDYHMLPPST